MSEYDDKNNRIKIISPSGNITRFKYDNRNNLIKKIYPNGNICQCEYKHNIHGNLTELYYNNELILKIKYKD
jgi:YD repeat-containing protein